MHFCCTVFFFVGSSSSIYIDSLTLYFFLPFIILILYSLLTPIRLMMSYPVKIFIPFLNHSMQQNFLRNASK